MNVPNKFIKFLSEPDYDKLIENHQTADNHRVRNRSQAILLSFQKKSVDEIAEVCGVHRNAVCRWINKWNEQGLAGLADVQIKGRPPILTPAEQEKAVKTAMKNPRFPHRQLTEIKAETGKTISKYTLKRVLKKRLRVEKNQIRAMEKAD